MPDLLLLTNYPLVQLPTVFQALLVIIFFSVDSWSWFSTRQFTVGQVKRIIVDCLFSLDVVIVSHAVVEMDQALRRSFARLAESLLISISFELRFFFIFTMTTIYVSYNGFDTFFIDCKQWFIVYLSACF